MIKTIERTLSLSHVDWIFYTSQKNLDLNIKFETAIMAEEPKPDSLGVDLADSVSMEQTEKRIEV